MLPFVGSAFKLGQIIFVNIRQTNSPDLKHHLKLREKKVRDKMCDVLYYIFDKCCGCLCH